MSAWPLSVPMSEGESFASWVRRAAFGFGVPVQAVLDLLGLRSRSLSLRGVGEVIDRETLDRVCRVAGLDPGVVLGSMSWNQIPDVPALDPDCPPPEAEWAVAQRRFGVSRTSTRRCQPCFDDVASKRVELVWWQLPIAFACERHRVLLADSCAKCDAKLPTLVRGSREGGRGLTMTCDHVAEVGHELSAASEILVAQNLLRGQWSEALAARPVPFLGTLRRSFATLDGRRRSHTEVNPEVLAVANELGLVYVSPSIGAADVSTSAVLAVAWMRSQSGVPAPRTWMRVAEIADLLNVTVAVVTKWLGRGVLPGVQQGSRWVVERRDLAAFIVPRDPDDRFTEDMLNGPWLTPHDVSARLTATHTPAQLKHLLAYRLIRSFRAGGAIRVRESDLRAFQARLDEQAGEVAQAHVDTMVSFREATDITGVTEKVLRRGISHGDIRTVKVGRHRYLDRADVERFAAPGSAPTGKVRPTVAE